MWTRAESMGDLIIFKVGTLNGQLVLDSLQPTKEISTKYRLLGFPVIPNTEQKERQ